MAFIASSQAAINPEYLQRRAGEGVGLSDRASPLLTNEFCIDLEDWLNGDVIQSLEVDNQDLPFESKDTDDALALFHRLWTHKLTHGLVFMKKIFQEVYGFENVYTAYGRWMDAERGKLNHIDLRRLARPEESIPLCLDPRIYRTEDIEAATSPQVAGLRLNTSRDLFATFRMRCILECKFDPEPIVLGHDHRDSLLDPDTSDTCESEDDRYEAYKKILGTLEKFRDDLERDSVIVALPDSQRRLRKDIRAWARMHNYGCLAVNSTDMMVHKDKAKIYKRPRKPQPVVLAGERQQTPALDRVYNWIPLLGTPPNLPPETLPDSRGAPQCGISSETDLIYSSAGWSSASADTSQSHWKRRRSRRQAKKDGYPCLVTDCGQVFDRACDLAHHQRSHRPEKFLAHWCLHCGKRFGYPKDLRRHEKIHQRKAEAMIVQDIFAELENYVMDDD